MTLKSFRNSIVLLVIVFTALLQGCASYYSHYAVFPAQNSAGEERQIRLTWQTADYPDWWIFSDKSTGLKVETQCSSRTWRLTDQSHDDAPGCSSGIAACGDPERDLRAGTSQPAGEDVACMVINPGDPEASIVGLQGSLELVVSCEPRVRSRGEGDEKENFDYLNASGVPYSIFARKAPRGSLNAKPPRLDDSVCDDEE